MENKLNNVECQEQFEDVEGYKVCREEGGEACMYDCWWPLPDAVFVEVD